jgi:hypothetical protein
MLYGTGTVLKKMLIVVQKCVSYFWVIEMWVQIRNSAKRLDPVSNERN